MHTDSPGKHLGNGWILGRTIGAWASGLAAGWSCATLMSAVAESPSFAHLPHPATALIQKGSENLLPSPGFTDGLDGWSTWGDVQLLLDEGEPVLRFGPKQAEESARLRVYIPNPKGRVLYRLRLEVKLPPDPAYDGSVDAPRLNGWLSHAVKGKNPPGPLRIREGRHGNVWLRRDFRLFSHPDIDALYILLGYDGATGEALTRRWEVVEEPIAATDRRVVLSTPAGNWAEMPHPVPEHEPTQPVFWALDDPDALHPQTGPAAHGRASSITLRATAGEMCVSAVALRTPQPFSAVKLAFSEFLGAQGVTLAVTPRWRHIVCHPRRTDFYGRGMTFHYVPDFFVERPDGVTCPKGATTGFWINLRVPETAAEGVYRGTVKAIGTGQELALPVSLEVDPFRLAILPNRTRHMYSDAGRWKRMSDEQVLVELADLRDHGYESLSLGGSGPITVENGTVTGFQLSDDSIRGIRLVKQAGLRGPFLFWGGWIPRDLPRQLGLAPQALEPTAEQWPERLTAATVDVLHRMKVELQALGVEDPVLVLVDEPGYWKKGSPERMLWDVKVARQAGWRTYCTSSLLPSDPIGQGLDLHCYGGGKLMPNPERARRVDAETRAAGQHLWYYCTGAYSGQIGNLLRNRYWGGFMFARCGAEGTASWTFQRPRDNAFDDFLLDPGTGKPRHGQPCITYPDPEHPGRHLDTPHWEGLRQAYHDHQYVETLRQAIARARRTTPTSADVAQQRLDRILDSLPWNGDPFLDPSFTNKTLAAARAGIAAEIVRLTTEPPGH